MIDYDKQLVSALNTILPTHYELVLTNKTKTPCISYQELNNYSVTEAVGATVGYSHISYTVKVWDTDIEALKNYAKQIDNALRPLGFKRVASGELFDYGSAMIQKILTYEALALEEY
jgi:hypothetical protein